MIREGEERADKIGAKIAREATGDDDGGIRRRRRAEGRWVVVSQLGIDQSPFLISSCGGGGEKLRCPRLRRHRRRQVSI